MYICSFQRGNALIPWKVRSLSRNETTRDSRAMCNILPMRTSKCTRTHAMRNEVAFHVHRLPNHSLEPHARQAMVNQTRLP
jgi:hypothetical protein